MNRTVILPTIVAAVVLLSWRDSSASLVLPDAEFSFSAAVLDAKEATDHIEAALRPLGFKITRRPRVRDDGFFRAEFQRPQGSSVSLSGPVSCVHVEIHTSLSRQPRTAEAMKLEAAEIYDQVLASLKDAIPRVSLFKSAGDKNGCEEAL